MRGSGDYDRKKKRYSHLSGGLCCCIVSVFGSGGKLAVFLLWREIFITTGKKKIHYDRKKKRYSRLSDGCAVLAITTGKKRYIHLSVGCAVLAITTGKKKIVVCLMGCAVVLFFVVAGNFDYDRKKKRYSRLSSLANVCIFVQPNTLLLFFWVFRSRQFSACA